MTVKHLADEWYTNYAEKNHRETTRNSERLIANRINHDLVKQSANYFDYNDPIIC